MLKKLFYGLDWFFYHQFKFAESFNIKNNNIPRISAAGSTSLFLFFFISLCVKPIFPGYFTEMMHDDEKRIIFVFSIMAFCMVINYFYFLRGNRCDKIVDFFSKRNSKWTGFLVAFVGASNVLVIVLVFFLARV